MPKFTWSYSSLSLFQQCPRKYYRLRVAKDIKEGETEALIYGKEVHKAAEDYVKDGTPIPEKFKFIKPYVDPLTSKTALPSSFSSLSSTLRRLGNLDSPISASS